MSTEQQQSTDDITELGRLLLDLAALREQLGIKASCIFSRCIDGHDSATLIGPQTHLYVCERTPEDAVRRLIVALVLEVHRARRCRGGVA